MLTRIIRTGALIGLILAVSAGPAFAQSARVVTGRETLDSVAQDFNICGFMSTFTTTGQGHWTEVFDDRHVAHITFQEQVNYTLVIGDGAEVPESLRGTTWRGRNMISFMTHSDPTTSREVAHYIDTGFEGPFRGLRERLTLVIGPDGTIRVERAVTNWDVDCEALGA